MTATVTDLSTLELFEGCEPGELERVAGALAGVREIAEGAVLCREGDTGGSVVDRRGRHGRRDGARPVRRDDRPGRDDRRARAPRRRTSQRDRDRHHRHDPGGSRRRAASSRRSSKAPRLALALLRELAVRLRHANEAVGWCGAATRDDGAGPCAPHRTCGRADRVQSVRARILRESLPAVRHIPRERAGAPRRGERRIHAHPLRRHSPRDAAIVHSPWRSRSRTQLRPSRPRRHVSRNRAGTPTRSMLRRDGDDHTRLRRLVSKVFTPRAIAAWRDRAESVVDRLLTEAAARDTHRRHLRLRTDTPRADHLGDARHAARRHPAAALVVAHDDQDPRPDQHSRRGSGRRRSVARDVRLRRAGHRRQACRTRPTTFSPRSSRPKRPATG